MLTIPNSIFASPDVRFGVNDTPADAQRLRTNFAPGHDLRLVFVTGSFVTDHATPCQGASSGGVISGDVGSGGVAAP